MIREWILSLTNTAPDFAATVSAEREGEGLLLRVGQPANRRVRLEYSTEIARPEWTEVNVPGTEWYFPAEAQEVHLHPGIGAQAGYFRVWAERP